MENDDSIDEIAAGQPLPALSKPVLWGLVAAKLLLHLPGLFRYGYFRDELYFLDWGYVDCAHQTHSMWGPGKFSGNQLIWLQWSAESLERICGSVELVGEHRHPWGMAEENRPIYLCREVNPPLAELWPRLRHWN